MDFFEPIAKDAKSKQKRCRSKHYGAKVLRTNHRCLAPRHLILGHSRRVCLFYMLSEPLASIKDGVARRVVYRPISLVDFGWGTKSRSQCSAVVSFLPSKAHNKQRPPRGAKCADNNGGEEGKSRRVGGKKHRPPPAISISFLGYEASEE